MTNLLKLLKLIEGRYSARTYLPQEVEEAKLNYILECARLAPSACNYQPWTFFVVQSDEGKAAVLDAYPREWIKTAPMYIVLCGSHTESWKREGNDEKYVNKDYCDIDAGIVGEHICLAAASAGLGTCWVCNFDVTILRKALNLADGVEPIAIFPIGYVDTSKNAKHEKKRKELSEITKWI